MGISYQDVLDRLIEERHRLSLPQTEMSRLLRMDQSNYCKVELGFRRLSYSELEHLCESGADVHYIYTGLRSIGQYADFFGKCTYSEILSLLNAAYYIVAFRREGDDGEKWRTISEMIGYIPLMGEKPTSFNIFLSLRRSLNWQQVKMAKTLGVDIKTLRYMEKGRKLPDSEMVSRLYELFRIPPAAVIRSQKCMESAASIFMEQLDPEDGKWLFKIMMTIYGER